MDIGSLEGDTTMFFRASRELEKATIRVLIDGKEIFSKRYEKLRPPEMERITVDFKRELNANSKIAFTLGAVHK